MRNYIIVAEEGDGLTLDSLGTKQKNKQIVAVMKGNSPEEVAETYLNMEGRQTWPSLFVYEITTRINNPLNHIRDKECLDQLFEALTSPTNYKCNVAEFMQSQHVLYQKGVYRDYEYIIILRGASHEMTCGYVLVPGWHFLNGVKHYVPVYELTVLAGEEMRPGVIPTVSAQELINGNAEHPVEINFSGTLANLESNQWWYGFDVDFELGIPYAIKSVQLIIDALIDLQDKVLKIPGSV